MQALARLNLVVDSAVEPVAPVARPEHLLHGEAKMALHSDFVDAEQILVQLLILHFDFKYLGFELAATVQFIISYFIVADSTAAVKAPS